MKNIKALKLINNKIAFLIELDYTIEREVEISELRKEYNKLAA